MPLLVLTCVVSQIKIVKTIGKESTDAHQKVVMLFFCIHTNTTVLFSNNRFFYTTGKTLKNGS
jgi:hypothetical protein